MHILTTGQLVSLAKDINTDEIARAVKALEEAQSKLANLLSKEFGIVHRASEFDVDGEIGSSFAPAYRGQPVPQEMVELDLSSDWARAPEEVIAPEPKIVSGTLYIAPSQKGISRVFAIPFRLKPGQSPNDLSPNHMRSWVQVGTLREDGTLAALNPSVMAYRNEIEGAVVGTCIDAEWLAPSA